MGHFYNDLGEPKYDAGLRDAKKYGYLPSVTSVEGIIDSYSLRQYMQNQVLHSSLTLTRGDGESDESFIERIKADSKAHSRKAAKLGTVLHHLAERYIMGKSLFFKGQRQDVWILFMPLRDWIDSNLKRPDTGFMSGDGCEVVLVNKELGYAGRADFIGYNTEGDRVLIDFKTTFMETKHIKKDGNISKAKVYDSWPRQLAALNSATYVTKCLSVVISSNVKFPGVWVYEWSDEEINKGWLEFSNALRLYKSIKGLK